MKLSNDDLRILILESLDEIILERLSSTDPGFCDAVSPRKLSPAEARSHREKRNKKWLADCEKKKGARYCASARHAVQRDQSRTEREYRKNFGQDEVLNVLDWGLLGAGAVLEVVPIVGTGVARGVALASIVTSLAQKNYLGAAFSTAMMLIPIVGTGLKGVGKTVQTGVKLPASVLEGLLEALGKVGQKKLEGFATSNLQDVGTGEDVAGKMWSALDSFKKSIKSMLSEEDDGKLRAVDGGEVDITAMMWCTAASGKKAGVSLRDFTTKMDAQEAKNREARKAKQPDQILAKKKREEKERRAASEFQKIFANLRDSGQKFPLSSAQLKNFIEKFGSLESKNKDFNQIIRAVRYMRDAYDPQKRGFPMIGWYKIKKGDNYASISRDKANKLFKTTPEGLKKANPKIDPKKLKVGQRIKLPLNDEGAPFTWLKK